MTLKTITKGWYSLNGKQILIDQGHYISSPKLSDSEHRYLKTYYNEILK